MHRTTHISLLRTISVALFFLFVATAQAHDDQTFHGLARHYFNNDTEAKAACIDHGNTYGVGNPCYPCYPFGGDSSTDSYALVERCYSDRGIASFFFPMGHTCPAGTQFTATGNCQVLPEEKNLGCSENLVKNPCNAANSNKYQREDDLLNSDALPGLSRAYNSLYVSHDVHTTIDGYKFGYGWLSSLHKRLEVESLTLIQVRRADGRGEPFTNTNGAWTGDADTQLALTQDSSGFTLFFRNGGSERYNSFGRLLFETTPSGQTTAYTYDNSNRPITITGPFGHRLTIVHDGETNHVAAITDPLGQTIQYRYGGSIYYEQQNLTEVVYPDGNVKRYHYENTNYPHALTGISYVDSANVATRYSTYVYDANGKAISTEHAGGVERATLTYDTDTQTTVRDAINTAEIMTFQINLGLKNLTSRVNQSDGKYLAQFFDANNNVTCQQDEEGRIATYSYSATNQRTSITEGLTGTCASPQSTSATRTVSYVYLSSILNLPTQIISPSVASAHNKTTVVQYGDTAHPYLPTRIIQNGYTPAGSAVSRSVGLTYNGAGQVIQIDGPRSDVNDITSLAYNDCATGIGCGQLSSIRNALGQTITFDSYDANGRLLQMTDSNGLRTSYTYDGRGRVLTVAQTPSAGAARTTTYMYTAAGDVASANLPNGAVLTYAYNAARQLVRVTDNLGNSIGYGYDQKGNRVQQYTYDPSNVLVRQLDVTFDPRNHISRLVNGGESGSLTQQIRDALGNLVQERDPNYNPPQTNGYDPLNRLVQNINRLGSATNFAYDINDRLIQVQAPNNATTQYKYDDLGNLLQEISPDRGTTNYAYDAAGNLLTQTDARGVATTYTYDALNRITQIGYPNSAENVTYGYDSCVLGVGKLCSVQDAASTNTFAYEAFGNIITQQKIELGKTYTTRYTYDAAGKVRTITYPDNRVVTYTRNPIGNIVQVTATVGGTTQNIVSGRTYRADGLLLTQTFGNGVNEIRQYDLQGRLTNQIGGGADHRLYGYDYNGNPTSIQNATQNGTYTYDAEDRLKLDITTVGTTNSSNTFTYDANGNRTKINSAVYSYAANSNKLANAGGVVITTDPAGNITQFGTDVYQYDGHGHLIQVTQNGTSKGTYSYNFQHQRTRKVAGSTTTVYHYDIFGNLILETSNTGTSKVAYVYDDSQSLIGHIKRTSNVDTLTYVHSDHEGTPRLGTNQTQTIVWKWEGRAFGNTTATQDPDGNSTTVVINQRYGNGYYDSESGLWYVWNRYYRPGTGRWITNDPIGLAGGLNTYLYARANPLRYADPSGLRVVVSGHIAASPLGRVTNPNSFHLSLYLKPDDPCTCKIEPITVGARPIDGNLGSIYNNPNDALSNAAFTQTIPTPVGMSDCDFIKSILRSSSRYTSNLPYGFPNISLLPFEHDGSMPVGTYNSNSFVSGVLSNAGITPPTINTGGEFQVPGYENPIPIGGR